MRNSILCAVVLLTLATSAYAADPVVILGTTSDYAIGQMTINGLNFRLNATPVVTLNGLPMTVLMSTWTSIVATIPAGVRPGSYALTVSFGKSTPDNAAFIATIDGGGPKGDKGDPGKDGKDGAPGAKGDKGDKGDPGTALASFDALAGLPCTRPSGVGTIALSYAADGTVSLRCNLPVAPPSGNALDVVLLLDTTGDMGNAIDNLKAALNTTALPAILAAHSDVAFAVAAFDDYPYSTYGVPSAGDVPYRLIQQLTSDVSTVQTAVNNAAATLHNGGDIAESGTAALYALTSSTGLSWPTGSVAAAPIAFRSGSKRIVVVFTSADFHNNSANANPYSFTSPSYADAVAGLNAAGAKTTAVFVNNGVNAASMANLRAYAVATSAVVPPAAFPPTAGCSTGSCCTAANGAGIAPDAPGGQCTLVFQTPANGSGSAAAVISAVNLAAQ